MSRDLVRDGHVGLKVAPVVVEDVYRTACRGSEKVASGSLTAES
jgi:hypothetical protein